MHPLAKWVWLVCAASTLVGFAGWQGHRQEVDSLGDAAVAVGAQRSGMPAHDFELRTLDGGWTRLADHRGRVVFLNFWATWCPPCLEELPALEALAQQLQGRGIDFVAVSQDESWADVQALFGGRRTLLTVALDPSGGLAQRYGTEKLPETYVLGRDGTVLARFVNVQPWSSPEMVAWFERLLASDL